MIAPPQFHRGSWSNHGTTLIILKPDAVQRGLMGRIISRFEDKGLQIVGAKFMQISNELASTHYSDHQGKPFYDGLVGHIQPVLVAIAARVPLRSSEDDGGHFGSTNLAPFGATSGCPIRST